MPWAMGVHHDDGTFSFVASYDVDAMDGVGAVFLTTDPDQAQTWPEAMDVINAWRTQGTVMPYRPDGQENRPLTALTIEPTRMMRQQHTPGEPAPVCPGCGAQAKWVGSGWQTGHEVDCSWMGDPEAEAYE